MKCDLKKKNGKEENNKTIKIMRKMKKRKLIKKIILTY